MFAKYLKSVTGRQQYNENVELGRKRAALKVAEDVERLSKQLTDQHAAHLAAVERLTAQLNAANERLTKPQVDRELAPLAASPRMVECAAYIADCADATRKPSFHDGQRRKFGVSGSALASALTDALTLQWVGELADGALYWRDAGLSRDCLLVQLADQRRAFWASQPPDVMRSYSDAEEG